MVWLEQDSVTPGPESVCFLSISVQGRPCLNSHLGGTKSVLWLGFHFWQPAFLLHVSLTDRTFSGCGHTGLYADALHTQHSLAAPAAYSVTLFIPKCHVNGIISCVVWHKSLGRTGIKVLLKACYTKRLAMVNINSRIKKQIFTI